jgi:archaellum component FlaC
MNRSEADGIDANAVRYSVERALNAMESVQSIKSQLTGTQNQIGKVKDAIDNMADHVRDHLRTVDRLVLEGSPGTADAALSERPPRPAQESLV